MSKKTSVSDIVIDRLIKKIESEQVLPWQKPFLTACMNWYSKHEYVGVNKLLLLGGEYITPNQLKLHNEKNGTNYWFETGTPMEIVVFYSRIERKISEAEAQKIKNLPQGERYLKKTEDGWVQIRWILKYHRVYNIRYIREITNPEIKNNPDYADGIFKKEESPKKKGKLRVVLTKNADVILKDGVTEDDYRVLEPKIGNGVVENHTPADEIVDKYTSATGVTLGKSTDGAYYLPGQDGVFLPDTSYFASTEAYYRVLFHELIHSTGIEERLNRSCFKDYHAARRERSKEELVAEMGGLFLASEAGFREDSDWAENSLEYVSGWCSWMKDNPSEVLSGIAMAEKAKNYILSGGELASGASGVRDIDNPNAETEEDNVTDEVLEDDTSISKTKTVKKVIKKDSKSKIMSIKTKKGAKEYFDKHLDEFFDVGVSERRMKEILATVKATELEHLYTVCTKEKPPARLTKTTLMIIVKDAVNGKKELGIQS